MNIPTSVTGKKEMIEAQKKMGTVLILVTTLIIYINWKIYIVSKELLDVSIDVLNETIKMNRLLGGDFDKMDN